MGNRLRAGIPTWYVTKPTRSTQPCIPLGSLYRVPALIGSDKAKNVTSAEWKLTLRDPKWHVVEVMLVVNCYIKLLYLTVIYVPVDERQGVRSTIPTVPVASRSTVVCRRFRRSSSRWVGCRWPSVRTRPRDTGWWTSPHHCTLRCSMSRCPVHAIATTSSSSLAAAAELVRRPVQRLSGAVVEQKSSMKMLKTARKYKNRATSAQFFVITVELMKALKFSIQLGAKKINSLFGWRSSQFTLRPSLLADTEKTKLTQHICEHNNELNQVNAA